MELEYKAIKAEIYNLQLWVSETSPEVLKTRYQQLLEDSEFVILQYNEHHFDVQGFTCFWLLGESHLAIHTFPENNKTYVELSSCNEEKLLKFKEMHQSYE